ncbi:MAG TPA: hypothetical protein VJM15_10715 [Sphingomicrobium sp.]|nr:hypothetical protein [Sphingomicrobium sp.]
MRKLGFLLVGSAALATAACSGGNEDQVNNAEMNQPTPELNALANDAANTAEADALGNQLNQLNQEDAVTDNTVNPADADEQNVSGM